MAKNSKKLQELKNIFEENEFNFELLDDVTVLKELREKLGAISDTRHESYVKHNLIDVIMITLLAILANANECVEIEYFVLQFRCSPEYVFASMVFGEAISHF